DLRQYSDALPDWDKIVELSTQAKRLEFRLGRAMCNARAGNFDTAAKEADELADSTDTGTLYELARVFAVASTAAKPADKAEMFAKRAVALLRQAADKGWKDVDSFKRDEDLKRLRDRDDVKKLIAELEQKPK